MRILLVILVILTLGNCEEYEYYEDYEEEPSNVLSYIVKEATKNAAEEDSSTDILNSLQEKLFVGTESMAEDPVYNFILGFSALALFMQAFYTPFGKTTIGKRSLKDFRN